MALTPDNLGNIANAVQLALTPAFLLTGIAGILNVMSGRLSRITDRGRALKLEKEGNLQLEYGSVSEEIQILERRMRITSMAITASTIAAFFVCIVIAMLFVEGMVGVKLDMIIAVFFAFAMLSLVMGLALYLREVHISMQKIRVYGRKNS